jgi:hypothetical protein
MTKLASSDIAGPSLGKLMAVIGKRVIHPDGRAVPGLGCTVVAGAKLR